MTKVKQEGKGNYLYQTSNTQNSDLSLAGYGTKQAVNGDHTVQSTRGNGCRQTSNGSKGSVIGVGDEIRQASTGTNTHHVLEGASGTLVALGYNSTFRADVGTLFCLTHYVDNNPVGFVSGIVGENGVLPNEKYGLDKGGVLVRK